jgi:hypothetical protein
LANAAGAIAARTQGDDYQARWFLIQAMRLFDPKSHVLRVAIEQKHLFPWFDDVITFYGAGARRVRAIDAHQVKFHIVGNGALSFKAMMDPAFINSKGTSLAQRIVDVYRKRGGDCDVVMVSPWSVHPEDLLGSMAEIGNGGSLRLDALFDGKRKSKASEIRQRLLNHVQAEEEVLHQALARLRIEVTQGLPWIAAMLDLHLGRHGFVTVGDAAHANVYDDLVRKIVQNGDILEFDRDAMVALLREAGLVAVEEPPERYRVGIRSFVRQAEHLDGFVDELLDLQDSFEHRRLREGASWASVSSMLRNFMSVIDDARHEVIELHIPCHNSIAFAAGQSVSSKSGTRYLVHQPSGRGAVVWDLGERAAGQRDELWSLEETTLRADAPDVAIAVGLTHSIGADVTHFVARNVPSIGKVITVEPAAGASPSCVRDGAHAVALAETLDALLADLRTPEERRAMLHVFMSAPNGFAFAFGRAARRIARTTIYEFDFERKDPEGYSPAIILGT